MSRNRPWKDDNSGADDKRPLTVDDLVKYLAKLAGLQSDSRTGNLAFSKDLRKLTSALKPYGSLPVSDLANLIKSAKRLNDQRPPVSREKITLPSNLDSISHKLVEQVIGNKNYSKFQLVRVGVHRFGISHSRLMRLNKDDVIGAIRAAMDHEKSLDALSQEAHRSGEIRSP